MFRNIIDDSATQRKFLVTQPTKAPSRGNIWQSDRRKRSPSGSFLNTTDEIILKKLTQRSRSTSASVEYDINEYSHLRGILIMSLKGFSFMKLSTSIRLSMQYQAAGP